jgi:hypothetical protein
MKLNQNESKSKIQNNYNDHREELINKLDIHTDLDSGPFIQNQNKFKLTALKFY